MNVADVNLPRGFTLKVLENEQFVIRHTNFLGPSKFAFFFLGVWLSIWTLVCIFLLNGYLNGELMNDGSPMPFWFVLAFWIPEFIVIGVLIFMIPRKYYYRFDEGMLYAESKKLLFGNDIELRRSSIGSVILKRGQVIVQSDTVPYILFKNRDRKKCRWLGGIISNWARSELIFEN
ncbi:MAG: hypothetical protein AAFP70_20070 [Calditrichota bacterium]